MSHHVGSKAFKTSTNPEEVEDVAITQCYTISNHSLAVEQTNSSRTDVQLLQIAIMKILCLTLVIGKNKVDGAKK